MQRIPSIVGAAWSPVEWSSSGHTSVEWWTPPGSWSHRIRGGLGMFVIDAGSVPCDVEHAREGEGGNRGIQKAVTRYQHACLVPMPSVYAEASHEDWLILW